MHTVAIYKENPVGIVRIFITEPCGNLVPIPLDSLVWNNFDDPFEEKHFEQWITLGDISDQLLEEYATHIFYVWDEKPLDGTIYQFGNYAKREWRVYANTRGYT